MTTINSSISTGVYVGPGNYLTVTNYGYVSTNDYGVLSQGGTIVNSGSITGAGDGVVLYPGSTITNFGNISGQQYAIYAVSSAITNDGTISVSGGSVAGIALRGNDTLINQAQGLVYGSTAAVTALVGDTISNSGTIASAQYAIYALGSLTLNIYSGAVFEGRVAESPGAGGQINLAGTTAGTLDMGGSFSGFTSIAFGSAAWALEGNLDELANGEMLSGLKGGDTILVENFFADYELYIAGTGMELVHGSNSFTVQFSEIFHGDAFAVNVTSQGTEIVVLCLVEGTRIATPDGERAVETLAPGDLVLDHAGEAVPIRWLGVSSMAAPVPRRHLPICIKAGALAKNLPRRDLLVSPDHALYLGGVLVQAGALVNGSSIVQAHDLPAPFKYYHIETAAHRLILAEGMAVETFVDNADRMNFDNWAEYEALHGAAKPIAEMALPRVKSARQLPADLRRMLSARTGALLRATLAA
jgi:hypothetical protein